MKSAEVFLKKTEVKSRKPREQSASFLICQEFFKEFSTKKC